MRRFDACVARLRELHAAYRDDYTAYYERNADDGLARHARRRSGHHPCARGRDVLLRTDKQTARVAGEFYVNAINVMRGAEAVSTYAPIAESEKFRIEYWALEEAKLRRMPAAQVARGTDRPGHGRRQRDRPAIAGRACGARAPASPLPTSISDRAEQRPTRSVGPTSPSGCRSMSRRGPGATAVEATLLAFGGIDLVVNNAGLSVSKPLLETTEADWDLQHDVMAKGSFLVAQAAARAMVAQGLGGDIVYIVLEERRLRRSEQRRLRRRARRTRPTRSDCWRPNSASTGSG